jgi:hypothetical protein
LKNKGNEMMSPPRKLLGLVPVASAILLSDKSIFGIAEMLIGGMVFWIPFWLAWWLSDGFSIFKHPCDFDDGDMPHHRGAQAQQFGENPGMGYRSGPQGFGFYSGQTRLDN